MDTIRKDPSALKNPFCKKKNRMMSSKVKGFDNSHPGYSSGKPEGPGWGSSWRRSVYVVGKSPHHFDETKISRCNVMFMDAVFVSQINSFLWLDPGFSLLLQICCGWLWFSSTNTLCSNWFWITGISRVCTTILCLGNWPFLTLLVLYIYETSGVELWYIVPLLTLSIFFL